MAATFSRTVRAVQTRGRAGLLFDLSLFVLFVGWLGWFLLGDVAVYEVSANARLETQSAPHSVAVSLPGRVVETKLAIGHRVKKGDVLMRLDPEADLLAVHEHVAHVQSCRARCVAIQHEIEAEQNALAAQANARRSAAEESRAQTDEVEARYRFAAINLERVKQLKTKRAASDQEVDLANAEVEAARA
jgi:multidrug resistance efflux pump